MLENKLEDKCCKEIEFLGGVAIKLKNPGYRGLPDRLVLLPGRRVFFIEFKRERTGRLSAQQIKIAKQLKTLGFSIYIIDNLLDFEVCLAKEK